MKKLLVIFLAIIVLAVGGIIYLLQPKSLGIRYTAEDLQSFNDKIKVRSEALPTNTPLGSTLVAIGAHPVDQTFTSQEVTAAADNRKKVYVYFPFTKVQIRVNADGTVDGSATVRLKDGINYLLSIGVSNEDIQEGISKFKIPNAAIPVSLKVSGNVINNQSQISVHQAQIAGIGVPQNLIDQYAPGLNTLVEKIIKDRSPSYSIEKLEVTDGKVRFKGTSPDTEKTVSGN